MTSIVRVGFVLAIATLLCVTTMSSNALGQSISLDDNPSAPILSPAGFGGGAEDEFGFVLPSLAPSPTIGTSGVPDGGLVTGYAGGVPISVPFIPNGSDIDAFSTNNRPSEKALRLHFSVDRLTTGIGGLGVESGFSQQPGDIFVSTSTFAPPAAFVGLGPGPFVGLLPSAGGGGSNALIADESLFGLTVVGGPAVLTPPGVPVLPPVLASHDNVDAFDLRPTTPGSGVYPMTTYFAVSPDEAAATGTSAADIFDVAALAPGTGPAPFAPAPLLGLDSGGFSTDSIDGLTVWDVAPFGGPFNLGPGAGPGDFALFSLSPGSGSLAAFGLSADDIFFTDFSGAFGVYALGSDLGVLSLPGGPPAAGSNIDAFDVQLVPEPSTIVIWSVLGLMGAGVGIARRRRKARTA